MRLEGFVSLLACAMFLFVAGFGLAALARELRTMVPDRVATPSAAQQDSPRSH